MRPQSVPIKALLISALLVASSESAMGDQPLNDEVLSDEMLSAAHSVVATPGPAKILPSREILASMDEPVTTPFTQRFHITKKGRVEYRQQFQSGDQTISLKLYGPVVKKRPGLGIKVRGLSLGDNAVEIEGYGNTKKQQLNFTIRF